MKVLYQRRRDICASTHTQQVGALSELITAFVVAARARAEKFGVLLLSLLWGLTYGKVSNLARKTTTRHPVGEFCRLLRVGKHFALKTPHTSCRIGAHQRIGQ